MHGSRRVPRFTMLKRRHVHQQRAKVALSLYMSRWVHGRELWTHTGRSNAYTLHGSSGRRPCLPFNHFKWALINLNWHYHSTKPEKDSSRRCWKTFHTLVVVAEIWKGKCFHFNIKIFLHLTWKKRGVLKCFRIIMKIILLPHASTLNCTRKNVELGICINFIVRNHRRYCFEAWNKINVGLLFLKIE